MNKNRGQIRLPARLNRRQEISSNIGHLQTNEKTEQEYSDLSSDEGNERLFGFVLPPFQRPAVWSREQQARFVESLWLDLPVGAYVVNRVDEFVDGKLHHADGWLIDGQQRLRALKAFFGDEITLFGLLWSDFNEVEKRAFRNIRFPHFVVNKTDEAELRDLYNRLSFGGTPHEAHQRA